MLAIFSEIFLSVINDMVCTTTRTINQNLLSWLNLTFTEKILQGDDCRCIDVAAASLKVMLAGFLLKAFSGIHTYSAKAPKTNG